jgi:hypothetical protein
VQIIPSMQHREFAFEDPEGWEITIAEKVA